jgi:hypothetical protein
MIRKYCVCSRIEEAEIRTADSFSAEDCRPVSRGCCPSRFAGMQQMVVRFFPRKVYRQTYTPAKAGHR